MTIQNNAIWFAKPADFNDPFDCAPSFSMAASPAVFHKYMMRLFREKAAPPNRKALLAQLAEIRRDPLRQQNSPAFIAQMREQTWRTVNEAGVLSLSTKADDVLMWSHYGASHTGVCLRFSGAEWAFPFRAAQPVLYSAARPVLNPILDDGDAIMTKSILTKADVWQYEAEWRVMSHPGSPVRPGGGNGLITFHPDALDGLIFGARTPDEDIAEVTGWLEGRRKRVELLRARVDPDHFRIHIDPL
ncbi:DUF2971 domain-containing protein [Roseomonas sp. GC11]|uniref:DUF2971 domain-containing protein n=1 Tax=Roseomonas sp. GC11 TaxID=2950546 RepID=UPI002108B7AD|nr:DUF2971 domain-containing protein [Roseomonas sp. GC11]